jgi:hypothetical protein
MYVWLIRECKLRFSILRYSDHSSCEGVHLQLLSSEPFLTKFKVCKSVHHIKYLTNEKKWEQDEVVHQLFIDFKKA